MELLLSQGGCLLSSTSKAIKLGNPQSPLGGCPQQVGFLGAFAGGLSDSADSSLDGSSGAGTAVTSQGSPERFASFAAEQQTIVEWPNASMRYIFLGEPQKSKLNDIVAYFRGCLGVTIASPYRDKHNPLSCMRIASSSREIMLEASGAIRALLAISLQHVRTVRLVMLDRQRAAVMADELALIKGIQVRSDRLLRICTAAPAPSIITLSRRATLACTCSWSPRAMTWAAACRKLTCAYPSRSSRGAGGRDSPTQSSSEYWLPRLVDPTPRP